MPTPTNPVKCTGNQLVADGRQQFTFLKGTETQVSSPNSPTKVVVPPDITLTMVVPAANQAGYIVGKMYDLQLTPISS